MGKFSIINIKVKMRGEEIMIASKGKLFENLLRRSSKEGQLLKGYVISREILKIIVLIDRDEKMAAK